MPRRFPLALIDLFHESEGTEVKNLILCSLFGLRAITKTRRFCFVDESIHIPYAFAGLAHIALVQIPYPHWVVNRNVASIPGKVRIG
jgi:hypothetical protein